jgi:hypothetical protein
MTTDGRRSGRDAFLGWHWRAAIQARPSGLSAFDNAESNYLEIMRQMRDELAEVTRCTPL